MYHFIHVYKKIEEKTILTDINISLPLTGLVIITGENGAGKSTLINMIGGIDSPTSGNVLFQNQDLTSLSEKELTQYREQYVSFIFQESNLFPNMTGIENITITGNKHPEYCKSLIQFLNVSNLVNEKVQKMSGGEKQKFSIIRALNKNAKVLLADEPTAPLDYEMKEKVFLLLKEYSKHALVILITHENNLIQKYADTIIKMQNGKIESIENQNVQKDNNNLLPNHNHFEAFKFTIKNLFNNKRKLFFGSILLIFSFVFLMLSSSFSSINSIDLHQDTLTLEKEHTIFFQKNVKTDLFYAPIKEFSEKDLEYINKKKISTNELITGKIMKIEGSLLHLNIPYLQKATTLYYQHMLTDKLSFIDSKYLKKVDYGTFPNKEDDIVISSYLADQIIEFGVMNENQQFYHPKDYQQIISDQEPILLNSKTVFISGIYDSNLSTYQYLKDANAKKENDIFTEKVLNQAGNIYIQNDFFNIYDDRTPSINEDLLFKVSMANKSEYLQDKPAIFQEDMSIKNIDNQNRTTLNKNEVIINTEILDKLELQSNNCIGKEITMSIQGQYNITIDTITLTIVGISTDENYYMSKEALTNALDKKVYVNKVILNESNPSTINKIFHQFALKDDDYTIYTNYSHSIEGLLNFTAFVTNIFKIITPIFILLAFAILSNYISNSIDLHKKNIAILKALGIDENKIQKIFIYEISILSFISFIISLLIFLIAKYFINMTASNILEFKINITPFQLINILMMIGIIFFFLVIAFTIIKKKSKKLTPQEMFKIN